MLKTLESKQGLRAGQLFQLSGIHDEKQQQPSGNMWESGDCLISCDSRCQISPPIRVLQRESLEQVEYLSYLCSITAQFSGDPTGQLLKYDITGKYHMAIGNDGVGREGEQGQMDCFNYLGPLMNKNFNCHQQGRQVITALLWQNFKIWCGLSISTAVKAQICLSTGLTHSHLQCWGGNTEKIVCECFQVLHGISQFVFTLQREHWPSTKLVVGTFSFYCFSGVSWGKLRSI